MNRFGGYIGRRNDNGLKQRVTYDGECMLRKLLVSNE